MTDVLIGKRAQVVIPAAVRRQLGLREGDRLHLDVDERGRIVLEKLIDDPIERLLDAGASCFDDVDPIAYQRELRSEWDR